MVWYLLVPQVLSPWGQFFWKMYHPVELATDKKIGHLLQEKAEITTGQGRLSEEVKAI